MREQFESFLEQNQVGSKSGEYVESINVISKHYSQQVSMPVDIYDTNTSSFEKISKLYSTRGKFAPFVTEQSLPVRKALSMYQKMLHKIQDSILMQSIEDFVKESDSTSDERALCWKAVSESLEQQVFANRSIQTQNIQSNFESLNFAYEKDLQKTLCKQILYLFPEYQIYGGLTIGVEFKIETRRIDVLLEHKTDNSLLVIELKSGKADFKVFGQLSMYMGLIKREFPDKVIQGLIIAGEIDESLSQATETNNNVKLMTYEMSIELKEM
ncbi:endonuclease NucS [Shewanella sp. D64]|uniref:endonuclease NucS domain-containing protein n=1 Tax=unclassified Shewanella TaxID=196818 RepID=UPI0022BA487A|nr:MULTISPECIES: endonuclease NucS domain-containing protein [unclassified Shewanella]MEC4724273.1 endonuclease NucS [Shewanella sp. D64]MEC4738785.1 endonuclease NucS [Shewanella sp. E94]WBJ97775.1 endonuclease NucS [Shewanella sp. MTB7]